MSKPKIILARDISVSLHETEPDSLPFLRAIGDYNYKSSVYSSKGKQYLIFHMSTL